jgi:hypothetical protein
MFIVVVGIIALVERFSSSNSELDIAAKEIEKEEA